MRPWWKWKDEIVAYALLIGEKTSVDESEYEFHYIERRFLNGFSIPLKVLPDNWSEELTVFAFPYK